MTKKIRTLKDVAMEGKDLDEKLARSQAYMNKCNAQVKSMQQTINYSIAMGNGDQAKALMPEYKMMMTTLAQAWDSHLELIAQVCSPANG